MIYMENDEYVVKVKIKDRNERIEILDNKKQETVTFGRGEDQDIILENNRVSREHGFFHYEDGTWYICDNNSKNGLLVDGKKVIQVPLQEGMRISLGKDTSGTPAAFYVEEIYENKVFDQEDEIDDNRESKAPKKGKRLMIGIIAGIALLIAAVAAVLFFTMKKKDKNSPETATKKYFEAYQKKDADAFLKLLQDEFIQEMIDLDEDHYFSGVGVDSVADFKSGAKEILNAVFKGEMGDYDIIDSFEILNCRYISRDEFPKGELEIFSMADKFAVVEFEVIDEGEKIEASDYCYRCKGKWYSVSAYGTAEGCFRIKEKSWRAQDLDSAERINSAFSSTLTNEDAYAELYSHMNGQALMIAYAGESFSAVDGIRIPTAVEEINSYLGGKTPEITYTGNGQCIWAIGIASNGKPIVWIGTESNETAFELQPSIDEDYR